MQSYIGSKFYPPNVVFDLRDDFHNLIFGSIQEDGIGQAVLIRRLSDTQCVCLSSSSGSADENCPICFGEGYLWLETLNIGYIGKNVGSVLGASTGVSQQDSQAAWGMSDEERALAYFEFDVFPNYERYLQPSLPSWDKLYELKVDCDGCLIQPVIRVSKWKIKSVTPHRGDRGRVEFFEVGLEKITV